MILVVFRFTTVPSNEGIRALLLNWKVATAKAFYHISEWHYTFDPISDPVYLTKPHYNELLRRGSPD
jgi:hypothetical protein